MEIITTPLGGIVNAIFALAAVIVGIILVLWLLKLLQGATGKATRGRNRRLAVIDSLALDPKRQLLIIRRDNVEHLILTGGPHDVVIETGIVIDDQAVAPSTRRPVPMVPARKPSTAAGARTESAARPASAVAATSPIPVPTEPVGAPGTVLAELQKQGRSPGTRAHLSLRHTGLLRPVSEMELPVSPEIAVNPAEPALDSATQDDEQRETEGTDLDGGNSQPHRN
ncbi:MAG: flagellar biosynthetic protein FliO [Devosia sp.]